MGGALLHALRGCSAQGCHKGGGGLLDLPRPGSQGGQALTDLLSADAAGTSGLDLLAEVPGQMTLAPRGQEKLLGYADLLGALPDRPAYVGEPVGGRGVVALPCVRVGELVGP